MIGVAVVSRIWLRRQERSVRISLSWAHSHNRITIQRAVDVRINAWLGIVLNRRANTYFVDVEIVVRRGIRLVISIRRARHFIRAIGTVNEPVNRKRFWDVIGLRIER